MSKNTLVTKKIISITTSDINYFVKFLKIIKKIQLKV
jgi:hypothetical protein